MFAQARLSRVFSVITAAWSLRHRAAVLLLSASCCFSAQVCAGHPGIFKLEDARSWRAEGGDYLNAQFSIELSSGAEEAVQNGVPLVFELQVQVVETHTWWWDSVEIEFTKRRRLQYNALSQSYQVKDINDGSQGNYTRLDDALRAAGVIENLLLTDQALDKGPSYSLRIRGSLDVESLPTPVRLIAYVSSDWGHGEQVVQMAAGSITRVGFGVVPMLVLFVLLLVSLSLLSDATHNSERFGQMYSMLLLINAAGLVFLGALVIANIIGLIRQRHMKAPGARMTSRLVVMFVVLAVVPVSVVYYFSLQFLQRGIDSWFDVRIEQGLDDALDLSRAALDVRLRDVLNLTIRMAEDLSDASPATLSLTLYDHRVRSGAAELTLIGGDGRIVASSSSDLTHIVPDQPPGEMMLLMRNRRHYIGLDPIGDSGLFARALVPVLSSTSDSEVYTLQALYEVSERFSVLADGVQSAYTRYKELSYLRTPLKFSYIMTLSIVLVLSLLAAIWAAFYSARRLVAPVRELAEATHAIAEGDYSKRLSVASDDELGFLVRSFNDMTRRLASAREQALRGQQQIEGQRAYLEAVLANLLSGVISMSADSVMRAINRTAGKSLGIDSRQYLGKELAVLASDHLYLKPLVDAVARHRDQGDKNWEEEISLFGANGHQVLMCRGTVLGGKGKRAGGLVIVFDDVTTLIQAQRDAAWGEVARRLAHEIKNPLTPIQLSAERLRRRYLAKMDAEDAELLDRATLTIVNQVDAMKKMVNAFSEYARAPNVNLEAMSLNKLIREVLDLYQSSVLKVQIVEQLGAEDDVIEGDAGRLRQLLHNLIKNALEAVKGQPDARVIVSTCSVAGVVDTNQIELCVDDNGPGFEPDVLENIFEPYVSTKSKGSGLGLAIVKKIVEEHGGTISAESSQAGGAFIRIRFFLLSG